MAEPWALLIDYLTADTQLTRILGVATVQPVIAFSDTTAPYIVYSVAESAGISYAASYNGSATGGPGQTVDVEQVISINCIAETYKLSWQVARQVQYLLSGWLDGNGATWRLVQGPADTELEMPEGSEQRAYCVSMAFKFNTSLATIMAS